GVLDAGDQDRGLGEGLLERRDERDRATDADVDRPDAVPGLGERLAGDVVDRPVGLDDAGLAGLATCGDLHVRTPGRVGLEVADRRGYAVLGGVAGRQAQRDLRAGTREQGVARLGDARGVDADVGDRGLGPQPLHGRAASYERHRVEDGG